MGTNASEDAQNGTTILAEKGRYLHDTVLSRLSVNNKLPVAFALDLEKAFETEWVNELYTN